MIENRRTARPLLEGNAPQRLEETNAGQATSWTVQRKTSENKSKKKNNENQHKFLFTFDLCLSFVLQFNDRYIGESTENVERNDKRKANGEENKMCNSPK